MAKRTKVECPRCHGNGWVAYDNNPYTAGDCHRCHGRGYIYQRPPVWVCPVCERHTQGLTRCGRCRCEKPKEGQ